MIVNFYSYFLSQILLERYPQLFDPNYEMEKRYNTYEFGLGKRSRQYSFGIGKRSGKFNFGLGKRSEAFGFRTEDDNNPLELIDSDDFEETGTESLRGGRVKRDSTQVDLTKQDKDLYLEDDEIYDDYLPLNRNSRMYSFGIGKRLNGNPSENPLFQFGLGKRPISSFNFGLGKRRDLISFENDNSAEDTEDKRGGSSYAFGLGKRGRGAYEFGLGKRGRGVYEFGLGKRGADSDISEYETKDPRMYEFGLGKRGPRVYEFGLGKRSPKMYEFGLGKRSPKMYEFGLGKREPKMYEFGLGKRDPKMYEFGLGKRRVYEFGLGKRKPTMYEFGLGKRGPRVYEFGLGKRTPVFYEIDLDSEDDLENNPTDNTVESVFDYSPDKENKQENHKKSRALYEFGLGKREAIFEADDLQNEQHGKLKNGMNNHLTFNESRTNGKEASHPKSSSNNVKSLTASTES